MKDKVNDVPEIRVLDVVSRIENPTPVYPCAPVIAEARSFSADVARILDEKLKSADWKK